MFDYINKVLYKTKGPDTSNIKESEEFVPYMVQRWCSMYSPQIASLINCTSNRLWSALDDKELWFNYMHGVLPPCKFKRICYIKKKKDTELVAKNKETVLKVANSLEISSREVSQYIEQFNLQLPNEKK
jgi:hypothetical protein